MTVVTVVTVTMIDVCGVYVDRVDEGSAVGQHARERSAYNLGSTKGSDQLRRCPRLKGMRPESTLTD